MRKDKIISLEMMVSQLKDVDVTDLNGEKVMMDIEKGQYFALNEVGSRIWEIIETPKTINEIISVLLSEYEIDSDSCEKAVLDFIGSIKDANIIQIS